MVVPATVGVIRTQNGVLVGYVACQMFLCMKCIHYFFYLCRLKLQGQCTLLNVNVPVLAMFAKFIILSSYWLAVRLEDGLFLAIGPVLV